MPEASKAKLTGKIIQWDDQKGYGYVQGPQGRLFLHRRDFIQRHKRPAVGDAIEFGIGQDLKGRRCAANACHLNDGGKITALNLIVITSLLVLPALALLHRTVDLRWAGLYVLALSLVSFRCYANDKQKARENEWRISEQVLQLTALLGGWPGAFLAQRFYRHKVSKPGFQFTFWLIVLAYQLAAVDSLRDWQFSKQAWSRLQQIETRHR